MIGSHFTYKENFDFASDGGGVNNAADILPGNIAVYLELPFLLHLILTFMNNSREVKVYCWCCFAYSSEYRKKKATGTLSC